MQDYAIIKQAFTHQSALLLDTLNRLETAEWEAPTRLEGWTVYTLVAHMLRVPQTVVGYAAQTVDSEPVVDRITYWNFDGRPAGPGITERALQNAAATTPENMAQTYAEARLKALHTLEMVELTTVISSFHGPIRFGEYLVTRLVELVAHSLDLQASLSYLKVPLDENAVKLVVQTLEGLLKQPRPASLSNDIDFIEAATGRVRREGIVIPAFT